MSSADTAAQKIKPRLALWCASTGAVVLWTSAQQRRAKVQALSLRNFQVLYLISAQLDQLLRACRAVLSPFSSSNGRTAVVSSNLHPLLPLATPSAPADFKHVIRQVPRCEFHYFASSCQGSGSKKIAWIAILYTLPREMRRISHDLQFDYLIGAITADTGFCRQIKIGEMADTKVFGRRRHDDVHRLHRGDGRTIPTGNGARLAG